MSNWIPNIGDVVAHNSGVYFCVTARAKNQTGKVQLWDGPRDRPSQSYPLEECKPVTLDSLPDAFDYAIEGKCIPVTVERAREAVKLVLGSKCVVIGIISDGLTASQKLAKAFNGQIFSEEAA